MAYRPNTTVIAHRIRSIFVRGIDLSPEAMRFIDSTFADPSAEELRAILDAESDSDRDSLLELLLSPDEAFQLDLEELLSELTPCEMDADGMVASLSSPPISVEFRLPQGRGAVQVTMTPDQIRRILQRLHIDRVVPAPVAAAIEVRLNAGDGRRLRVMLREGRFEFCDSINGFLGRLIEGLEWEDPRGWETLAFAVELLAGIDENADIHRLLVRWKGLLLKALEHGRRQREATAAANIETLLSRGHRLTWVDEAAARRQLACIDRICLAAFGRIDHLETRSPEEEATFSASHGIAEVIRRLS
jgi:hypothetical protein